MSRTQAYIFQVQKFSLHDGAGIRTAVFMNGCPLKCKWCCNPESRLPVSDATSGGKLYTLEALFDEVMRDKPFYDKSGGGVTLTGGEVCRQAEFAISFALKLRAAGVGTAIETCAHADEKTFRAVVSAVDFVFADCKHYDEDKYFSGTGVRGDLIFKNIKWLAESGKPYCVRIPVVPDYNDALSDAQGFGKLLGGMGVKKVELMPFHQLGEKKYSNLGVRYEYAGVRQTRGEELKSYRDALSSFGIDTVIGG